jgi:thioredoxin-like negative regulator of GroEL
MWDMEPLNSQKFESFIAAKSVAATHFDAEWNSSSRAVMRGKMREAEASLSEQVNFGEVDCDASPELAKSIRLLNVPSVAYYKHGKLIRALIGEKQDVRSRLERILRGESIGRDDGLGGAKALVG